MVCWIYAALVALLSGHLANNFVSIDNISPRWLTPLAFVLLGFFVSVVGCYSWWITICWPTRIKRIRLLVAVEIIWCVACLVSLVAFADNLTSLGNLFLIASGAGVFAFLVPELVLYRRVFAQPGIQPDAPAAGGSAG